MQVREFDPRSLDKMLPCPFCGGEAELDTHQAYAQIANGKIGHRVVVYCADCGADQGTCVEDVPDIHPNEVIERWNKRATNDAQSEREKVLVEALRGLFARLDHPGNGGQHVNYFLRWPEVETARATLRGAA